MIEHIKNWLNEFFRPVVTFYGGNSETVAAVRKLPDKAVAEGFRHWNTTALEELLHQWEQEEEYEACSKLKKVISLRHGKTTSKKEAQFKAHRGAKSQGLSRD